MNEEVRNHVNIESQNTPVFMTRVFAIFESEAEKFQKVPTLVGLKTGKRRTKGQPLPT
jgi:hypothetical protein